MTCLSSAFAAVKVASIPTVPFNGSDYVGEIVAAEYQTNSNESRILIMTTGDNKNQRNQFASLTLSIDANDLPLGNTLAGSVGKKIAVIFSNGNYEIADVTIITDKYYYGDNKRSELMRLK